MGPLGETHLDGLGKSDLAGFSVPEGDERERRVEHQLLTAVGPGRYADTGEPEQRLGQVGNGRHGLIIGQEHQVASRARDSARERRGVEYIDDFLGRKLVRGLPGYKDSQDRNGQRKHKQLSFQFIPPEELLQVFYI